MKILFNKIIYYCIHILIFVYSYHSNSWLIKISSNGRYLAAPTMDGGVFIFNLRNGQVTGILRDHDGK